MSPLPTKEGILSHDPLDYTPRSVNRKTLRLGMMHYHLKPGGVTSVMRDMAYALLKHSAYESIEFDIIANAEYEAGALDLFGSFGKENPEKIRIVNIQALSYNEKPYTDRASFVRAADKLADEILQRVDLSASSPDNPYILHSHNISLGKNPTATMAFKLVAEKATERSLPIWLINQVHDFAEANRPEQMNAFYKCSGKRDEEFARTFVYPIGSNILYLTINSSDIENLLEIGIHRERIFLLPDPVDIDRYEQPPLWEGNVDTSGAKASMLKMLSDRAAEKKQIFDPSLPVLLSPMKVMRRKNNIESLLLQSTFRRLGRKYQLLVTLDANSPPDIAYSSLLKEFAALRKLPVAIGIGKQVISENGHRRKKGDVIAELGLSDIHALSRTLVTTSIAEGFGLTYHEGWLSQRPVIGRRIGAVVRDFERAGMDFDHMYDKISVSLTDLPALHKRLREEYQKKIIELSSNKSATYRLPYCEAEVIIEEKLFRSDKEDCIDFADLSAEMQVELLAKMGDDPVFANRFIDRNPALENSFYLIEDENSLPLRNLIEKNSAIVRSRYSLKAMAQRLMTIFDIGDSLYRKPIAGVPLTAEDHAKILQKYGTPENIRLIL